MARPARALERRFVHLRLPLRSRRLELVVPALGHIPEVVRLLGEPSVARWTLHIPFPYRVVDGRQWVRRASKNRRSGSSIGLTILRRSDGVLIGGVGLHRLEPGSGTGEVGYWVGREHRGHGYAAEAVDLLVRAGFNQLALHRIEARVFPGNLSSRSVVRRCGFRYEGRMRDEVSKDGRWRATLLYSRLATDPPARR
ncbi:MAG TPA: GNAT family N-acetyltransferase [Thermoplasmata archaeon]|nr:GNAT family N-acetyltransferase [Thermoplasmata archaeon]